MNWSSIIEGAVGGVAASIVLGLSAYGYTKYRNHRLRKALKQTLTRFSNGQNAYGVSIGISNYTSRPITIRSVSLSGKKSRYRLNPEGETSTLSIDRNEKLSKAQLEQIKTGKMVQISQEIGFTHSWREQPPISGFIEIAPYTSHSFLLRAELLVDYDDSIDGILIIAEYSTWDGSLELIEGRIVDGMDGLNHSIEHYVGQIKSGSLNKGRAAFGIPALKIPQKPK